jgi:hypothetical protein
MGSSIRYARSGDAHIAYRTLGTGPIDLVIFSRGSATSSPHPDRATALVFVDPFSRITGTADYPRGMRPNGLVARIRAIET